MIVDTRFSIKRFTILLLLPSLFLFMRVSLAIHLKRCRDTFFVASFLFLCSPRRFRWNRSLINLYLNITIVIANEKKEINKLKNGSCWMERREGKTHTHKHHAQCTCLFKLAFTWAHCVLVCRKKNIINCQLLNIKIAISLDRKAAAATLENQNKMTNIHLVLLNNLKKLMLHTGNSI